MHFLWDLKVKWRVFTHLHSTCYEFGPSFWLLDHPVRSNKRQRVWGFVPNSSELKKSSWCTCTAPQRWHWTMNMACSTFHPLPPFLGIHLSARRPPGDFLMFLLHVGHRGSWNCLNWSSFQGDRQEYEFLKASRSHPYLQEQEQPLSFPGNSSSPLLH